MKTQKLMLSTLVAITMLGSCKKEEKIIDCFGDAIETSVHVSISASNSKQVNTEVRYWGRKVITRVKWEFGDGATATTTGLTASHTYLAAGNYTVKARVTIAEGKSSCEVDPTKVVTVP